jgi:hypothetical protein
MPTAQGGEPLCDVERQRMPFWSKALLVLIADQQAAPGSYPAYQFIPSVSVLFSGWLKPFPSETHQGENTSGVVLGSRLLTNDQEARRLLYQNAFVGAPPPKAAPLPAFLNYARVVCA